MMNDDDFNCEMNEDAHLESAYEDRFAAEDVFDYPDEDYDPDADPECESDDADFEPEPPDRIDREHPGQRAYDSWVEQRRWG